MRAYVDEGYNAVTAEELATAAHSHGGVRGVTTFVVPSLEERTPKQKPTIQQITSLSNFEFSENFHQDTTEVTAWKAYNVGPGVKIELHKDMSTNSWINKGGPGYQVFATETSNWSPMKDQQQGESCMTESGNLEPDEPMQTEGLVDTTYLDLDTNEFSQQDKASCLRLFKCPAENCVKSFNRYANLMRHISIGMYYENLEKFEAHS